MSTTTTVSTDEAPAATRRRSILFWIRRYLPAEIACTVLMILGGLAAGIWTDSPPIIALAALIGETVGFYGVLMLTVYIEQSSRSRGRAHALRRTALLLVAEFGAAELLDSLVLRPGLLTLGVWLLPDPVWGLLAGKIAADVVFYAVAASAFTVTTKAGLREAHSTKPATPSPGSEVTR